MKILLLLYDGLSSRKAEVLKQLEENYRFIRKRLGLDTVYATVTQDFTELLRKFPELCFIPSPGSLRQSVYKGLKKLKDADVLLVDGGSKLEPEGVKLLLKNRVLALVTKNGRWAGLAYVPLREVKYLIKSAERQGLESVTAMFEFLKNGYALSYATYELGG
ncbi:MAG: hypothetical protein GXO03_05560 [Aquificae bacterium]|nr:hypothetical protein [Aquificota bacterium]